MILYEEYSPKPDLTPSLFPFFWSPTSLRSKCLQSSYCAKVGARAEKNGIPLFYSMHLREKGLLRRLIPHPFPLLEHTLRALSNSQNWPARPWPDQTFWQWNRFFPRGFAEKPSPLCIMFRIWLIRRVSFY